MYTDYGRMIYKSLWPKSYTECKFLEIFLFVAKMVAKSDHYLPSQNGIWVEFQHFLPKNDGEKWSRKNVFEIPPSTSHFLLDEFTSQKGGVLIKSTSSVIKIAWCGHGVISKKILVAYLRMIIETLSHKFHPYSILTG